MPALARLQPTAPRLRQSAVPALVALVAAVGFAALCDAVGEHDGITSVDGPVSQWFALHRTALEGSLGLLLAKATGPAVLVAATLVASLLLHRSGRRLHAAVLSGSVLLAYAVGLVAKLGEHRARPLAPVNLAPESEASFPSGHVLVVGTLAAVAVVLAWQHLGRAARVASVVLAASVTLAMALDRLVVGAHWLTDVLGSLALVAVIAATASAVVTAAAPEVSEAAAEG